MSATLLAIRLHRHNALPYALLTVGIITYIVALLVQVLLLRALRSPLLAILPVGALTVGLLAGFTEELARFFGYQYLARSAETKPQALMIGLGHGFSETIYTGLLALGLGISLLGYGAERPDDLGALLSGAVAEAAHGLLPIAMHMALSWLVLQVFLRGQIYWLFLAIFFHSLVEITAVLLGPN
ncbi:MAG TPA: YhfC family glutamic-type intramembrane protease, partial [Aggregatilineaceae bacterium]|nr:YhfC family glutamic-type intramembrane protease [Aggregatilineaceae bacterium]